MSNQERDKRSEYAWLGNNYIYNDSERLERKVDFVANTLFEILGLLTPNVSKPVITRIVNGKRKLEKEW